MRKQKSLVPKTTLKFVNLQSVMRVNVQNLIAKIVYAIKQKRQIVLSVINKAVDIRTKLRNVIGLRLLVRLVWV